MKLGQTITVMSADDATVTVLQNDPTQGCPFWGDTYTRDLEGTETLEFTIPGDHFDARYVVNKASVMIVVDGGIRPLRIERVTEQRRGLSRTIDSTGVATAMIGVGKDASGNRVTFASEAASAAHPAGKEYVIDTDALQSYGLPYLDASGNIARQHVMGLYDHGDTPITAANLLLATLGHLQDSLSGAVTYEFVTDDGTHTKTAYCEGAMNELGAVVDTSWSMTSEPVLACLTDALAGTRWSAGRVDSAGLHTFALTDTSRLADVQAIRAASGLELQTRYTCVGSRVTGRYIDLVTGIGTDKDVILSSLALHLGAVGKQHSWQSDSAWSGEELFLGDTVMVSAPNMTPPVGERVRVREITRCLSDPTKGSITFGNRIPEIIDRI